MTEPEHTGLRDLYFSQWIRKKLPDSYTGFRVTDLDFILWNEATKQVILLEIKSKQAKLKPYQHRMWGHMNRWLINGCDWEYLGFHLVTFENTSFEDGRCFFDHDEISESELIEKLSLCPSLAVL